MHQDASTEAIIYSCFKPAAHLQPLNPTCSMIQILLFTCSLFYTAIPSYAVTSSCCSLTAEELGNLASLTKDDSWDTLGNKCDDCQVGKCRMMSTPPVCIPPGAFPDNAAFQADCQDTFDGVAYPDTVGLEDKDIRSCIGDVQDAPNFNDLPYTPNCCSLTFEELDNMRGTADGCPPTSGGLRTDILTSSCGKCPVGMCRNDERFCYCPGQFLASDSLRNTNCAKEFGIAYPESVGLEDTAIDACSHPPSLAPSSDPSASPSSMPSTSPITTPSTSPTSTPVEITSFSLSIPTFLALLAPIVTTSVLL